jgi:hypothetical protein
MGSRGTWEEDRRREKEFRDRVPSVIIIGAGHIGLETAARLKHLGVSTLVVEKNKRVGDNVSGFIVLRRFTYFLTLVFSGETDTTRSAFMIQFVRFEGTLSRTLLTRHTQGFNTMPIMPCVLRIGTLSSAI